MTLKDDIKNTQWSPLSPADRGPTAAEVIARAEMKWAHGTITPEEREFFRHPYNFWPNYYKDRWGIEWWEVSPADEEQTPPPPPH